MKHLNFIVNDTSRNTILYSTHEHYVVILQRVQIPRCNNKLGTNSFPWRVILYVVTCYFITTQTVTCVFQEFAHLWSFMLVAAAECCDENNFLNPLSHIILKEVPKVGLQFIDSLLLGFWLITMLFWFVCNYPKYEWTHLLSHRTNQITSLYRRAHSLCECWRLLYL